MVEGPQSLSGFAPHRAPGECLIRLAVRQLLELALTRWDRRATLNFKAGKQVACLLSFPGPPPATGTPCGARQPGQAATPRSRWDVTVGRAHHYQASARGRILYAKVGGCDSHEHSRRSKFAR